MSNFDDYITGTDKPFAENINDALLLTNVFDLTVPIQVPTMFRNSTWVDTTSRRKCGVAIVTLKEALPSGVSISAVDGKSVLTGTGTVKLGFYPNFNSFGRFKSISWENTGTVQINLKTVNNTTIANNISKGNIENASSELRTLQEIVIEIVLNNSTLKTLDVVMENKQQERYGAECGITDVIGLEGRLTSIENKDISQDALINSKVNINDLIDLVYPVGSIYMSVNSTNPSTILGGTWERLKDKFLLASGDTYSNGATGGEAKHTLTKDEMPSHTHTQNSHTHTQNAHAHGVGDGRSYITHETSYNSSVGESRASSGSSFYVPSIQSADNWYGAPTTSSATATNQSTTATNQSTGGGQSHNNMPPYLAVNMWKRTS